MLNKPCKERRSQLNIHSRISANFQFMTSLPSLFTIKVECPSSCNLFAHNINPNEPKVKMRYSITQWTLFCAYRFHRPESKKRCFQKVLLSTKENIAPIWVNAQDINPNEAKVKM